MPLDRACEELIRGVSSGWLNGSRGLLLAASWMTDRAHRAKTAGEGENARFARPGTTRRYSQWTAPRFSLCSCVLPLRARAIGEEVAGPDPHRRSPPARLYSGTRMSSAGRSRSWGTDRYGRALAPRKVRAPQGRLPGNAWVRAARASRNGQCNRKQTAVLARGR